METALIAGLGPVFVFCMLLLVIFLCKSQGYESGQKRAGRQGENYVCDLICQVLKEKDLLFSNVSIEIEGKRTELDHIIVNNRGIFIIEVKNYSGSLMGSVAGALLRRQVRSSFFPQSLYGLQHTSV